MNLLSLILIVTNIISVFAILYFANLVSRYRQALVAERAKRFQLLAIAGIFVAFRYFKNKCN